MDNYTKINSETIDEWVQNGVFWGDPITHDTFVAAQNGNWSVTVGSIKSIPHEWFTPFLKENRLDGVRLLGLASGGGQQMPIFTALGAFCTILDYSMRQLDSERLVAEREGYAIEIVHADMTLRLPFEAEVFDVIFHPISNCYIEDMSHIWRECYRVLKHGGVLIAGLDNGVNFLFEEEAEPLVVVNPLPFNPLKMDAERRQRMIDNREALQFSHTMEDNIGGQLKAGFILTDLFEDSNLDNIIGKYIPQNIITRAVKP